MVPLDVHLATLSMNTDWENVEMTYVCPQGHPESDIKRTSFSSRILELSTPNTFTTTS